MTNGNAMTTEPEERTVTEPDFTPTRHGRRKCAEFLVEMKRLGWKDEDLDQLEQLFWQVRDANGNIAVGG